MHVDDELVVEAITATLVPSQFAPNRVLPTPKEAFRADSIPEELYLLSVVKDDSPSKTF
jgi:hypothetical protein